MWADPHPSFCNKKRKLSTNEKSALSIVPNEESTSSIVPDKKFRSSKHAEKTLEILESYFNDKLLTDVTLVTSSKCINAHRVVLSASSPYLATLIQSHFEESIQDAIEMKEIDGDALLALVQYCYTGSIELQEDNVEILLSTACLLQINPVVEACSQFLSKQLDPCNCLGIRTFAEAQACDSLSRTAKAYALEHFVRVVQNQEFLLLSADKVTEFLESEDVNVPSEETIFNALTTWLKHDSINRVKDASKLLSYVRLPLLKPEFIAGHIEGNELFNDQKAIQGLILEAFRYHLLRSPTDSLLKSGRIRPRKSTVDILVALGEIHKKENDKGLPLCTPIDAFDLRKNTWKNITNFKKRGNGFGAVCFGYKLFVVGGCIDGKVTNIVKSFDFFTQLWKPWPPMQTYRNGVGVRVLNGFLYAVGGHDNRIYSNTVERCDLTLMKWSFVVSMSIARCYPGVAVVNNKLYVVGGASGPNVSNTMECYDPQTNKWTFCSPISEARMKAGIGVVNGYIYAIGGTDGKVCLESVERYDPKTDEWTTMAPMSLGRDEPGVGVLGDRLFVVGGDGGNIYTQYLTSVEVYDPALNEWQELAPMEKGRAGPCVVINRTICKL